MDGANPSQMDIKIVIPVPTYCLYFETCFPYVGKIHTSSSWENKKNRRCMILSIKMILLYTKKFSKLKIIITLVLTSLLLITVPQSLRFRIEEKIAALLVYSPFVQVATSGFRLIPCSVVVVIVGAQLKNEPDSFRIHHNIAARLSRSSMGDVTRLVATEHVRINIHSASQYN